MGVAAYGAALALLVLGVVVGLVMVGVARLLSPNNPTPEKQLTYECGEKPIGTAWLRFNVRFYVIALVFVLFGVEMVLTYPVAVLFKGLTAAGSDWRPALVVFMELLAFLGILALGLVYVWKKGDLSWVRTFRPPPPPGMRSWEQSGGEAAQPVASAAQKDPAGSPGA
jgi:NADH-quinone oxidoreductase subunit A